MPAAATLTQQQLQIAREYDTGKYTQAELGLKYGIPQPKISRIIRHVEATLAVMKDDVPVSLPSAITIKNPEIISGFSNLTAIQKVEIENVDGMTDTALCNCMQDGLRITMQILAPLCTSFIKRFKRAKQDGKDFHGFTDFDRAAESLTGYSGRQIRNLAAGTRTPLKKDIDLPKAAKMPAWTYQPFIDVVAATNLYQEMLKLPWRPHRSDGLTAEAIHYGVTYDADGARPDEISEIPDFLCKIADSVSEKVGMPVNYVQCHKKLSPV